FPAHTNHILQPFDVGIAAPFKREMKNRFKNNLRIEWKSKDGKILKETEKNRLALISAIIDAKDVTLTRTNCINAWRATGLHPFDKNRVLQKKSSNQNVDMENVMIQKDSRKIRISGQVLTDMELIDSLERIQKEKQEKSEKKRKKVKSKTSPILYTSKEPQPPP